MNTKAKGDKLETEVFALLEQELRGGRLGLSKDAKIFSQKAYYSKDRESDIIFDIAIEVYPEGSTELSFLVLIECKNYSRSVPVGAVQNFSDSVKQVGGHKGIMISTSAFQEGALNVCRSRRIGVMRYFNKGDFEWTLRRSVSAGTRPNTPDHAPARALEIFKGITETDYQSSIYDLYCYSDERHTNSLSEFIQNLLGDEHKALYAPPRNLSIIRFIPEEKIEDLVAENLAKISYSGSTVPLRELRRSLRVNAREASVSGEEAMSRNAFGKITFNPLEIVIFRDHPDLTVPRRQFTVAHELGHYLLGHGRYMQQEFCGGSDIERDGRSGILALDIARMEWQANRFASCLLLPREQFIASFIKLIEQHNIKDKGYGVLYVDNGPWNLRTFISIVGTLASEFGVSQSVVEYRLKNLGLLNDKRITARPAGASVSAVISDRRGRTSK